jgi:hypothetical protein
MQRRAKEGSIECGAERRGCILLGRGGDGEEGRRSMAVALKGEEETG